MKAYITLLVIILHGFSTVSAQNNSSKKTFTLVVDLLQEGEQYEIVIKSVGCFHNRQQSLFIFRQEDTFVAELNDSKMTLNQVKIDALKKFERQLFMYAYDSGACTTLDTYVLKYGPKEKAYKDGSCSRFFGRVLLQELGFSG